MTTELIIKTFGSKEIRTVIVDDEPYWVGKDVCETLGYSNESDAMNRHCKGVVKRYPLQTPGGVQDVRIIPESDLLRLIVGSKLPEAAKFERWIFEDVLPSIRKHGGYLTPAKIEEALLNPDTLIRLATDLKEERAKRLSAETKLIEQAPKVLFADAVSETKGCILIRSMAKILDQNGYPTGERRFFATLRQDGYLCKSGQSTNEPTQYAMNMGLFRLKETAISHSDGRVTTNITAKVTGKGQVFFVKKYLGRNAWMENDELVIEPLPLEAGGTITVTDELGWELAYR